ncbi:MAG: uroporphyrinogen decarboxylase family protein [Promethearchaeota archaeon]
MPELTGAERLMRTFRHQKRDKISWQPRFMYWYSSNRVYTMNDENAGLAHAPVPRKYWGKEILEIHDMLRASPRYPGEALPGTSVFSTSLRPGHGVRSTSVAGPDPETRYTKTTTPVGSVTEAVRAGYHLEYQVKSVEDLKVVEYVLDQTEFHFNDVMYEIIVEGYEGRSVPCSYFPRSPLQRCILEYLGFERTALFLRKYPDEMREFMDHLGEWNARMWDVILACPIPVVNFGENVDCFLDPPHWYERYLVPYYERWVAELHRKGKFCHCHFDGNLRDLLPLMDLVDFDGIEAATPRPQGDVTLEEIKDAIGDKVLLDGIPATLLMKEFPERDLVACVERIFELFSPNLVLGISDEMPPNAEITRMETVADMVDDFQPF